ncbi:hypothetical protein ACWGH8_28700 [Nonomuraea muscovyensis]|uniref:Uncharacterized protein n=1 Tax=Nonomuraea muscovyensis TaxID=1124761 RepID=A0A7X0C191_9ACTN|nr:hypothetical protein [Nonomuraea muscovyensis]MBB6346615.1 hypothetical protein [Nonomuraea muscovyensis]
MTATLLAGCLLATSCGATPDGHATSSTLPSSGTPLSSTPVSATGTVPTTPTTPPVKGPEPVKPTGDAIDVRKVRWTKAKPVAKGRKVQLVWTSGVAPCTVLDRVKVKETRTRVTITLYEGTAPTAKNVSCIMIAIEKTTTVKLRAPLGKRKIVDGAKA